MPFLLDPPTHEFYLLFVLLLHPFLNPIKIKPPVNPKYNQRISQGPREGVGRGYLYGSIGILYLLTLPYSWKTVLSFYLSITLIKPTLLNVGIF